jgi:hypothetical protein
VVRRRERGVAQFDFGFLDDKGRSPGGVVGRRWAQRASTPVGARVYWTNTNKGLRSTQYVGTRLRDKLCGVQLPRLLVQTELSVGLAISP